MPIRFDGTEVDAVTMNGSGLDNLIIDGTEVFTAFDATHVMTVGVSGVQRGFSKGSDLGSITPLWPMSADGTINAPGSLYEIRTYDSGSGYNNVAFMIIGIGSTCNITISTPTGASHTFTSSVTTVTNSALANYIASNGGGTADFRIINNNE